MSQVAIDTCSSSEAHVAAMKPSLCPPSGEAPHFDNVPSSSPVQRERQGNASVACAFVLCACM